MTDARPVFAVDASGPPEAFVVSHTLKFDIHEEGEDREWFVALNSADLVALKNVIDRALEKQSSLTKALRPTAVPILDWESSDGES